MLYSPRPFMDDNYMVNQGCCEIKPNNTNPVTMSNQKKDKKIKKGCVSYNNLLFRVHFKV